MKEIKIDLTLQGESLCLYTNLQVIHDLLIN